MLVEPTRSLPAKVEHELVWATEEDRAAWLELQEANKTLNLEYMLNNQPFNDLPWQYFPKPQINHRPPIFNYSFPLVVSELEHIAHEAGILKPKEPLTGDNIMTILVQAMRYLEGECGLLREEFLSVAGCYSRTVRFVLMLKTNYNIKHIPPEKLERIVQLLGKYFPGKIPQWYLDPDIAEGQYRDFTIPVEVLL